MSPWIETDHQVAATRWLDESAVALRGQRILDARSTVSADLHRTQQPALQTISGRSFVSAALAVQQVIAGSASGSTTVSGITGWLEQVQAASAGSSLVSGELMVGLAQYASAASPDSKSTVSGILAVKIYSHITGVQAGDDWSDNEPTIFAGRDSGPTRGRFTPHSVGLTNERETWHP
jgi:hypothetical protein